MRNGERSVSLSLSLCGERSSIHAESHKLGSFIDVSGRCIEGVRDILEAMLCVVGYLDRVPKALRVYSSNARLSFSDLVYIAAIRDVEKRSIHANHRPFLILPRASMIAYSLQEFFEIERLRKVNCVKFRVNFNTRF